MTLKELVKEAKLEILEESAEELIKMGVSEDSASYRWESVQDVQFFKKIQKEGGSEPLYKLMALREYWLKNKELYKMQINFLLERLLYKKQMQPLFIQEKIEIFVEKIKSTLKTGEISEPIACVLSKMLRMIEEAGI